MTYMIPFRINGRKYITTTLSTKLIESEYVCEMPQAGVVELLCFRKRQRATSDLNKLSDVNDLGLIGYDYQEKEHEIILTFAALKDNEKEYEVKDRETKGETCLINEAKEGYWILQHNRLSEYCEIKIRIILKQDKGQASSLICLHLVPKRSYYTMVLDFGSEASQSLLENEDAQQKPLNNICIAKTSLTEWKKYENLRDEAFHQWADDKYLFKSMFYVKDKEPQFLSRLEDDDLFNNDKSSYLMPNLKIALLDHADECLNYYQKIVSCFIRNGVARIIEKHDIGSEHLGIQLNLLIPNVMSMKLVDKMIARLLIGFKTRYESIYAQIHFEITAYSESDTSFAGYVLKHQQVNERLQKDCTYLIVDGGKGTTDFSIMQIKSLNKYESLYRDGFVGAGNAITYALFDHLCAMIIGSTETARRRELMQQLLFGELNDQAGRRKLLDTLEKIKAAYSNKGDMKSEQRCRALHEEFVNKYNDLTASGLAEYLNRHLGSYGDKYGIIHATCHNICAMLIASLQRNRISSSRKERMLKKKFGRDYEPSEICFDQVILAGRAFKFVPLREELGHILKDVWGCDESEIMYNAIDAKRLCLYGAIDRLFVNYNCGMSGIPGIATAFAKDDNHRSLFDRILGEPGSIAAHPIDSFHIDENFLIYGKDILLKEDEYLNLNGHKLSGIPCREKEILYNLYYCGNRLLLRSDDNVYELNLSHGQLPIEQKMIFESRFPLYSSDEKEKITLWTLPDVKSLTPIK